MGGAKFFFLDLGPKLKHKLYIMCLKKSTKTSIRYAKENDREKERERKKGRRRDIKREGEIERE